MNLTQEQINKIKSKFLECETNRTNRDNFFKAKDLELKSCYFFDLCESLFIDVQYYAEMRNLKDWDKISLLKAVLQDEFKEFEWFCDNVSEEGMIHSPEILFKQLARVQGSHFFSTHYYARNFKLLAKDPKFYFNLLLYTEGNPFKYNGFIEGVASLLSTNKDIYLKPEHVEAFSYIELKVFLSLFLLKYHLGESLSKQITKNLPIQERLLRHFFTKDVDAFALILNKMSFLIKNEQKLYPININFSSNSVLVPQLIYSVLLGYFNQPLFFADLYQKHPVEVCMFANHFSKQDLVLWYSSHIDGETHVYTEPLKGMNLFFKYYFQQKLEYIQALQKFYNLHDVKALTEGGVLRVFEFLNNLNIFWVFPNIQYKQEVFNAGGYTLEKLHSERLMPMLLTEEYPLGNENISFLKEYLLHVAYAVNSGMIEPTIYQSFANVIIDKISIYLGGFPKNSYSVHLYNFWEDQFNKNGRALKFNNSPPEQRNDEDSYKNSVSEVISTLLREGGCYLTEESIEKLNIIQCGIYFNKP